MLFISKNDFLEASKLIQKNGLASPLIAFPNQHGKQIFLKAECLQPSGSFKIRGATYTLSKLPDDQRKKGVVAYSTGNHAQAVALAAAQLGISATIVMSPNVVPYKLEATKKYGADLIFVPISERQHYAEAFAQKTGAYLIPPFDHLDVITGQGTIGLEILAEVTPAAIFVPVGGGGLIAGIALAVKQIEPQVKIIGVEPELENDAFRSFHTKQLIKMDESSDSIADAVKIPSLGQFTFPLILKYVDDLITVSEEQIREAMLHTAESGLVVEPSGAIALAGALSYHHLLPEGAIVCIASGGNIS